MSQTTEAQQAQLTRQADIIASLSVAANCVLNRSSLTNPYDIQCVVSDLQDAIGILAAGLSRPPTAH